MFFKKKTRKKTKCEKLRKILINNDLKNFKKLTIKINKKNNYKELIYIFMLLFKLDKKINNINNYFKIISENFNKNLIIKALKRYINKKMFFIFYYIINNLHIINKDKYLFIYFHKNPKKILDYSFSLKGIKEKYIYLLILYIYKVKENFKKEELKNIFIDLLLILNNNILFEKAFQKIGYIFLEDKNLFFEVLFKKNNNFEIIKFLIEKIKENNKNNFLFQKKNDKYFFYNCNNLEVLNYLIEENILKDYIRNPNYYIDNNRFKIYDFLIKHKKYMLSSEEIKTLILTLFYNLKKYSIYYNCKVYTDAYKNIELIYFFVKKYKNKFKEIKLNKNEETFLISNIFAFAVYSNMFKNIYNNSELIEENNLYKLRRILIIYFKIFIYNKSNLNNINNIKNMIYATIIDKNIIKQILLEMLNFYIKKKKYNLVNLIALILK